MYDVNTPENTEMSLTHTVETFRSAFTYLSLPGQLTDLSWLLLYVAFDTFLCPCDTGQLTGVGHLTREFSRLL